MVLVKIHDAYRTVVAVCDSDLLGKKFEEEQKQIDLTGKFFEGEEKSEEELRTILSNAKKEDATFNVVGEESCRIALDLGLINEEGILKVQNIPVALSLM